MNGLRIFFGAAALCLTVVPAFAQAPKDGGYSNLPDFGVEKRLKLNYAVSIGNYVPDFAHGGYSRALGYDVMFAYVFPNENYDLRLSTRWQAFDVGGFGQSSQVSLNVSFGEILFRNGQFYYGPGIGLGSATQGANVADFTGATVPVVSLCAGWDFNRRLFVEARGQAAHDAIFDGFSINMGYRF